MIEILFALCLVLAFVVIYLIYQIDKTNKNIKLLYENDVTLFNIIKNNTPIFEVKLTDNDIQE